MTIHEAALQLRFNLFHHYEEREATTIADLVMEHLTGWTKIDRIVNKQVPLSAVQQQLFQKYTRELQDNKPLQYVINEAWFYRMRLYVDEQVLIPRPETEELVDWVLKEMAAHHGNAASVLDIGTGSGCIAIALAKNAPWATVHACDISPGALQVAGKNAADQQVSIAFQQLNILDHACWQALPRFDVIVSNPPYVPASNKAAMAANVLAYEPALALFVEDNDPLQFYRAIAAFAEQHLSGEGFVFFEIHEEMALAVADLLKSYGFKEVIVEKDLQGKDRMIKAGR